MNIGKNILGLRRAKNVTQEELAAELGVTAAAVSKWENGYTLPDILMLCALADHFEVTTDELLGRSREWKYAVIAAETPALGKKIEVIAKQYGIAAQSIHTNYQEAVDAAEENGTVRYIIAGFYSGWYGSNSSASTLVSVHPSDAEILVGLQMVFDKYLDEEEHQFIVN